MENITIFKIFIAEYLGKYFSWVEWLHFQTLTSIGFEKVDLNRTEIVVIVSCY